MGVANNFGHTPPEVEKYHGPRQYTILRNRRFVAGPNFEISGVLSRFLIHPGQDAAPWRYLVFHLCCSLRGNLALAGFFVGIVADRGH
jgi:hypothetical protein